MTWRPTEATLFLEKAAAPAVTDDQNEGYLVGDIWIDETNDAAYLNLDVTVGAAVWKHISLEEAAIDHTAILNIGTTTHADIDTHIGNADIHFLEGAIDHTNILSIGLTSHADIDTAVDELTAHVADGTKHFLEGAIDHGSIAGLTDVEDHAYALLITGARPLTGDWDIGDGRHIAADEIRARDGAGLSLKDDSGTLGIFIADGGGVTMKGGIERAVLGDATPGRVLRIGMIKIEDGSNADTLKCTLSSYWNGDSDGPTDNVAKDGTTGNWTLDVGGHVLKLESAALTGTCLTVVSANVQYNTTGVVTNGFAVRNTGDIEIRMYNDADGVIQSIPTMIDVAKQIQIYIAYMTTE